MQDKKDSLKYYIESAVNHADATQKGDYKNVNKNAKNLSKIYKIMEKDSKLADELLDVLFVEKEVSVRLWSFAHALGLNKRIKEAEIGLKQISVMGDNKILKFGAKMTLKAWKDQGFLKF